MYHKSALVLMRIKQKVSKMFDALGEGELQPARAFKPAQQCAGLKPALLVSFVLANLVGAVEGLLVEHDSEVAFGGARRERADA